MRKPGVVLIAILLAVTSCKKDEASVAISSSTTISLLDMHRASTEMETRMANLWNAPLVSKATDQFFDSLGSNTVLKDKGMALLTTLQADPKIAGPINKLMADLIADPSIKKTVIELMAQHPGASPDEIGTMVGDRFAQAWSSPEVSMAWAKAWDGLLRRIGSNSDLASIEHSVFTRFESKYNDAAVTEKWNKRMSELAAGQSSAKMTDIFLDKFFGQNRIETIVADVLNNQTFRSESAAALGKLITLQSVTDDARKGAAEMLADPIVFDSAVILMKQLTNTHPDAAQVSKALDALLSAPSVVNTVKRILHTASTDPAVAAIGNAWMTNLSNDAGLKADFDKFIYGW